MLKPNSERILRAIVRNPPGDRQGLSIAQIANEAHCSHKTVKRHLKSLTANGYIVLDRPNTGTRYSYFVKPEALKELESNAS